MITAKEHPSYSYLAEMNPEAKVFPQFHSAYLGVGTNGIKSVAIYDFRQCVLDLVGLEDMRPTKASEFLYKDVIMQMGQTVNSPIFLMPDQTLQVEYLDMDY